MKSIVNRLAKSEALANLIFSMVLLAMKMRFGRTATKISRSSRTRLKEKNLTAQLKLKDNSCGRYFTIRDGRVISRSGIHASPDVTVIFGDARVALDMLVPPRDQLAMINAMKNFQLGLEGPEELSCWWMETLSLMLIAGTRYGTDMGNGVMRYTSNTNGGPVFVYVKDGKIIRITPIEFRRQGCAALDHQGQRQDLYPSPQDDHLTLHPRLQIDDLFAGPAPLPDEAGRF